ncbi:MAG TPA: protein-disulfide reductase DsbD domain-containing protein [Thermoanaerobaculia bacterium]|jgi:DsbC/DsbD-like thiol-disulfide interchange protein|nr:protein-disulfide reductase DsbD domain-containing protein [Thermoanaerobaculia bacterium]
MTAPKIVLTPAALALALLMPPPAHGAASVWSVNDPSQVRLITAAKVAPRTGEMWMGLQFRLKPGWHVYWKNSGDAGYPPAVTFQPADVLGKPEIQWPAPQRFDLPGGLVAFGYENEVIYPIRARLQPAAAPTPSPTPASTPSPQSPDTLKITADLDYLVCQVDCVPFRYTLTLDQPVGIPAQPDPETAPLLQAALERLPKAVGELTGVTTEVALDASLPTAPDLEIRVRGARAEAGKTDLFLETNDVLEAGRPRVKVVPDGVVFHVAMKPKETNKPLSVHLPIAWTVTHLAANGHPFSLEARRDVGVSTGAGGPPLGNTPQPPASRERLARLLLSAFLGGALLNLMPPVLALLLAELLLLRAGERGRVREGAAAAATGTVGSAWLVALLAVAAHRAGLPAGWGAQLQEPVLAAFLAVLSAMVTLNLWGVVEVPLASPDSAGASGTGRHLLAGLVATPLALAWPVPLLNEPVSYALGRGPATMAAVFAVLGLGLALPYLLLAVVPALLRVFPASLSAGSWLPRVREGLGFLAGTGAFWVLYALSRQVSTEGIAFIELALLAMSLLAWLRHREGSGRTFRAVLAVGLLACAAGALWLADHNRLVPRAWPAAPLYTTLSTQPTGPNNPIPGGRKNA